MHTVWLRSWSTKILFLKVATKDLEGLINIMEVFKKLTTIKQNQLSREICHICYDLIQDEAPCKDVLKAVLFSSIFFLITLMLCNSVKDQTPEVYRYRFDQWKICIFMSHHYLIVLEIKCLFMYMTITRVNISSCPFLTSSTALSL